MAIPRYNLPGPQVEPGAGYWLQCKILEAVRIDAILKRLGRIQPFTDFDEAKEFAQVQDYYRNRKKAVLKQSRLLTDPIFFRRVPAGAVLSTGRGGQALPVSNGVELASLFEGETPGLWHRHVLNVIFDPRVKMGPGQVLSPPRQALVWAALDVAIMRALSAAWFVKWLGGKDVEYRRRPFEYAAGLKPPPKFQVLYDLEIDPPAGTNGKITRTHPKNMGPMPSPGTPRHPAYPSGHSTYSAAASAVLACLFNNYDDPRSELKGLDWPAEFDRLAENIGVARFYGGVHWETDHMLGRRLGRIVGEMVIEQLNEAGIPPVPQQLTKTPPEQQLEREAQAFKAACGEGGADLCAGIVPDPKKRSVLQNVQ